jgi:hypothetical protein
MGKIVAKVRHRVFEIYETVDEGIQELVARGEKAAPSFPDSESWRFTLLDVKCEAGLTLVRFKQPRLDTPQIAAEVSDDFSKLEGFLTRDSRVLLDFTGVESVNPNLLTALALFDKRLRIKGSRIVLCSIGQNVRESFWTVS